MVISEVPLRPSQAQAFTITLGDANYGFSIQWRDAASVWIMDISDERGTTLLAGQPLLPGADLIGQYPELEIAGEFWIVSEGQKDAPPTFDNLGVGSHLYFVVRD